MGEPYKQDCAIGIAHGVRLELEGQVNKPAKDREYGAQNQSKNNDRSTGGIGSSRYLRVELADR